MGFHIPKHRKIRKNSRNVSAAVSDLDTWLLLGRLIKQNIILDY